MTFNHLILTRLHSQCHASLILMILTEIIFLRARTKRWMKQNKKSGHWLNSSVRAFPVICRGSVKVAPEPRVRNNTFSFFYFMVFRKKLLFIALLTLPIYACTSINIRGNEAVIKKVYGFPIYNVTPSNQSNSVYIRTTGIGVIKGVTGISIGYLNETYAAVPAGKCSIEIGRAHV